MVGKIFIFPLLVILLYSSALAEDDYPVCRPNPTACMEEICSRLGNFGCDEAPDVIQVVNACQGNYGDACVNEVCLHLSSFSCDSKDELLQIARACRGNVSGECVSAVCKRVGSNECDDLSEILHIAASCGGAF